MCSDIPDWLQEFRENLVDDRVPERRDSLASSSHEVSLQPTSKRREDWVNTVFILISLKTEIARSVKGAKLQVHRAKQKLLRKHKGACKSSWSQIGNLKSFTRTIPWNLAKLVKIFPGIIARLHHTDQKQMGLLKSSAQSKRRHTCRLVAIRSE